jgi:hypothetical protein
MSVLRELVVMLADGGDCVSDLASRRNQPELFGQVCSTPTAWRVLAEELAADPHGIAGLWSALARVRERAWALGAAPAGPVLLDLDATLVEAHSDKQGAAPTYKQGFGFHPLGCWLDRGDGTGEALAMIPRPGNAGSNTAADHVRVLAMACWPCPGQPASGRSWCGPTPPAPPRLRRRTRRPQPLVLDRVRLRPVRPNGDPGRARPGLHPPALDPDGGPAGAPGSPSSPPWTLPARAGPRAPGRSAAAPGPGWVPLRTTPPFPEYPSASDEEGAALGRQVAWFVRADAFQPVS